MPGLSRVTAAGPLRVWPPQRGVQYEITMKRAGTHHAQIGKGPSVLDVTRPLRARDSRHIDRTQRRTFMRPYVYMFNAAEGGPATSTPPAAPVVADASSRRTCSGPTKRFAEKTAERATDSVRSPAFPLPPRNGALIA